MVDPKLAARRAEIVQAHLDAENRHDVAGAVATFHHPCYDVVATGVVSDGAQAVGEFLHGVMSGFPDYHAEVTEMHHAERAVIAEGTFGGTHLAVWAGIEATRKSVNVRFCAVFDFEEDRMLCERIYFDFATILRQLGAL